MTATLNGAPDPEAFVALSRELAELEPVVGAIRAYRAMRDELSGIDAMLAEPGIDAEMRALAEEERPQGEAAAEEAGRALNLLLLPRDAADEKSAILEVRAGTGGDEAALFAGDLFRMYARYADLHGWRDGASERASEGTAGGFKEVIAWP